MKALNNTIATDWVAFLALTVFLLSWQIPQALAVDAEQEDVWRVSEPRFSVPAQQIAIDADRGTWMSLDVSPDGQTIAFDFLGDIYLLPIEGGAARNVSAGFQWDMQPRFSPDGQQIAFTSDRSGGDNIWVMDADGKNPRQITHETFRLTNNPSWSPDGQYIAARKHFTTQRSLGTGEIWLYHIKGGDGVPAVERPSKTFQKELGEPMFNPDGSGIYFTQNVTGGDRFIYAQDTNKEVFGIKQLNLADGSVGDIARGPGGAVRPTPSPDGRYLAFVRRVRAQSRLFIKDLRSGAERMLVDQLDQDMQESWAVQGVYPNMAFTPDSKRIVYWAGGKIHSVAVDTGVVDNIPFQVRDQREIYPAPRFPVAVDSSTFTTRMPRWAQLVPGTQRVVFENLGRLYTKVGVAAPQPLVTNGGEGWQLFPQVSRDGRWIFYVHWRDQELGQIMRVSSRGGRAKVVTKQAGHYRELALSPDGKTLFYRQARGGYLLDDDHSLNDGIYRMPSGGGEPALVTRNGSTPQFAGDDGQLYLVRSNGGAEEGGAPPRKLVSLKLPSDQATDVAGARFPSEMQISPDGRHVAYIENYHAYVAALPRTGKLISLGAKERSLPQAKLSAIGATFIHWIDSQTLGWSVGPTYKTATVEAAFAEDFEPIVAGIDLGVTVETAHPESTLFLTNARIATMVEGAPVIENGSMLIENQRISAVGADMTPPPGATVVDLAGKTVLPGFIDAHAHGPYAQDLIVPEQNWSLLGHLALGVTTVHDPSSSAVQVFAAAEYAKAGRILAPRIFSTGEIVYGAQSYRWAQIESLDDALAHVRRLKSQGAISVKNYNQPRREQRQQVVEAARQEGMMVVAEGGALYHMDLNMVADGNTGIEHSLPQLAIYEDVVQFWRQTNVGYTPTLVVGFGTIEGENYWYDNTEVWRHPILAQFVPPRLLQARSVRRQKAPESDYKHAQNAAIGKQLADAGVLVQTGAHGQREGLGTHWELWMFVQGGMTPLEALAAATRSPARYLGLDEELGTLEPGKLADLVVIDGDVTRDIRVSDRVTHVMLNGRLFATPSLSEQFTGEHELTPMYWQDRAESQIR